MKRAKQRGLISFTYPAGFRSLAGRACPPARARDDGNVKTGRDLWLEREQALPLTEQLRLALRREEKALDRLNAATERREELVRLVRDEKRARARGPRK
jgi:hypothetical protein